MGLPDVRDGRDGRGRHLGEVAYLARPAHRELQDECVGLRIHRRERERHAGLAVVVRGGRRHAAHVLEGLPEHQLHGRLADAAGDGEDSARHLRPERHGHPPHGLEHVGHADDGALRADRSVDHDARRARFEGLLAVQMTVGRFPAHREERVPGAHLAGVHGGACHTADPHGLALAANHGGELVNGSFAHRAHRSKPGKGISPRLRRGR